MPAAQICEVLLLVHPPASILLERNFFLELAMNSFFMCSIRCRAGAQAAQDALPKLWPADQAKGPGQAINQISICGESASPKV